MSNYYSQEEFDKRMEALKKAKPREGADFSLANAVALKNYANAPTRKKPSFVELAEEYITQNEDNKPLLDNFRKLNPLQQRIEIKNNLVNLLENASGYFYEPYVEAESLNPNERNRIRKDIFDNLTNEIDYLSENATKQDLEFQRYKDIFNVPNWTNKAMNDFLENGKVPSGYEMSVKNGFSTPFYKGARLFGEFMTGYKFDPSADKPSDEIFYDKVKGMYENNPVEDRFGKTPLAERFKNKEAYAQRPYDEKAIGFASRFFQVPYLNTLEQAKAAGAIPPEYVTEQAIQRGEKVDRGLPTFLGNDKLLNAGEIAFDAAMMGSPWLNLFGKGRHVVRAGNEAREGFKAINALNKIREKSPQLGLLAEASLKGSLIGAKTALEGEEMAVPTTKTNVLVGASTGGVLGGLAYKFGRKMPKLKKGGETESEMKEIQKQLKLLGTPEQIERDIEETENVLKAIKTREQMFGGENIGGFRGYAQNFRQPMDKLSTPSEEIAQQALNIQKTHTVDNPVFYANVEGSPYEVGFNLESPLQNTPRASITPYETLQGDFMQSTLYNPATGIPLGAESETRQALANTADYFARNEDYTNALRKFGIDLADESKRVEQGSNIFGEFNAYLDEPIAEAVIKKADDNALNAYYDVWKTRNFPNGVKDEKSARQLFDDKFKMAQVNYREQKTPTEFSKGLVENTDTYKNVKKRVSNIGGERGKKLLSELNKAIEEGKTIDEISGIISSVSEKAGGVNRSAANYAADLRSELSPNVVLQRSFDRAKGKLETEEKFKNFPQVLKEAQELEARYKNLESVKQGLSPLAILAANRFANTLSYPFAKGRSRTTTEDVKFTPKGEEQMSIDKLPNSFPFNIPNAFWDSPLVRLRSMGSFNIPQE